nr:hypothetical protein CPGR_01575 [Mycolicibacterium malmesburyense]
MKARLTKHLSNSMHRKNRLQQQQKKTVLMV